MNGMWLLGVATHTPSLTHIDNITPILCLADIAGFQSHYNDDPQNSDGGQAVKNVSRKLIMLEAEDVPGVIKWF